jgi:hypothetical protein
MLLRLLVVPVLAGTALAVPAAPASADACAGTTGVTVVVDFASLGGGEQTRCTATDPPTGLAALRGAGFTPTRAAQQPGYFVCRIDGKPANDPCQRTSPANAYWSYWHAKRGGMWTFSDMGAADYDPPPGTVEGWSFGAGTPPSSPPPAATPASAAPAASPHATPRPTTATSPAPSPPAPAMTRAASPAVTVAATRSPSGSPSPAPTGTSPGPTRFTTFTPPPSAQPDLRSLTRSGGTFAIPLSVVAAALVVAGLAAAAARQAVVRRRRENP